MSDNPLNVAPPSALPPGLQALELQGCGLRGEPFTTRELAWGLNAGDTRRTFPDGC
jgi:hypothetical protein